MKLFKRAFEAATKFNFLTFASIAVVLLSGALSVYAQTSYEGLPISGVEVSIEGAGQNRIIVNQFETTVRAAVGEQFSAVKNREALQELFNTGRVASARLEVIENQSPATNVRLRFVVRRTTLVDQVRINVAESEGDRVTEAELLLRLNLLTSNSTVSERALQQSADAIQTYLRDRGFYNATIDYTFDPPSQRDARNNVTFNVNPNAQALVENFALNIKGFDAAKTAEILDDLKLKKGERFSRAKLDEDIARIRRELVKEDYLAANLSEPDIRLDSDENLVSITLNGNVNAKVEIRVENELKEEIEIGERTQREIFPIRREGQIDRASIETGRRRLRSRFQEDGYFFANVNAVCSIEPFMPDAATVFRNSTEAACDFLDGLNLEGKTITVLYQAELNRRFRLTELRLEGTDKLTIDDIKPALRSQTANALAIIPRLGYGRGFTSNEILQEDIGTIRTLMRELGYRKSEVRARQGISPEGEDLIITFAVTENALTRVAAIEINGNTAFSDAQLQQELPTLINQPYSRVRTRNGNNRILNLYAREGFIDARSTFATQDVPSANPAEEAVKIVYTIEPEGQKTFVNRILTVGNEDTKRRAILDTIPLKPGELLRADRITASERNLYSTGVFQQVIVTTEPAGANPDGTARRDVLLDLREDKQRVITFGAGVSTDDGPSGSVDVRFINLFGSFYQGGARVRASRRQQLVQFDFTNPRFLRDVRAEQAPPLDAQGGAVFAPLTVTAQFLRDTGVTRFFRTNIDRGTDGIVQRLDAEGNPIDVFGNRTSEPSIDRYTLNIETSRTLNRQSRSLLFVRYRFERVLLANVDSLLLAPILQPDRSVTISGIGATYARDTRQNCNNRRSLLERIRTGEDGDPCQYNASDATRGEFLTLDYQLSARFLLGDTSFNKFQATYQRYFQFGQRFRKTVIATRAILGVASLFSVRDRDGNGTIDETDRTLPISERFFSGGSTNLRGFGFQEAGPRRVIVPQGIFRNGDGELINNGTGVINPFTVPVGGNALAVINLEARVPLSDSFQAVPFYDGGNVFRRASEIFSKRPATDFSDIEAANLRSQWSNTVGLGIRLKTPIGGSVAVDFGFLLNPPQFVIPQVAPPNTIFTLKREQIHFRFTQAF